MPSEVESRQLICEIGRRMYERRMVAANDGNISVRLGGERDFVYSHRRIQGIYETGANV